MAARLSSLVRLHRKVPDRKAPASAGGRSSRTLAERAYDTLEEMIVSCALPPGQYLAIQDLQERTGLGRTPIHLAVNRLAMDTLVLIRPRHGLQIAPIDLVRTRTLLRLRRDIERFVVQLACEHGGASARNQMLHIAGLLRAGHDDMNIDSFNRLDRRIDRLFIGASGEPFLEHTLRPLHTVFRRTGWIYHSRVRPGESMAVSIELHLAILDAAATGNIHAALLATDALMRFVGSTLDALGHGADPALFDCNLALESDG